MAYKTTKMKTNNEAIMQELADEFALLMKRVTKLHKVRGKFTEARELNRTVLLTRFMLRIVVIRMQMAMTFAQMQLEASQPNPKYRKGGIPDVGICI